MWWRVEVSTRSDLVDPVGVEVLGSIRDLGLEGVRAVRFTRVYFLEGDLEEPQVTRIARELLADPVAEVFRLTPAQPAARGEEPGVIEVVRKPGVMDPVEGSTRLAVADLGLTVRGVKTARRYLIDGSFNPQDLHLIAQKVLANGSIEDYFLGRSDRALLVPAQTYVFRRVEVPIREASPEELERISREGQLWLNREEMLAIQAHFRELGRDPTDVELETLAQTWSEHCVHKTFKGLIDYHDEEDPSRSRLIDNLLRSTVMRATEELAKPWCVSVFKDNAGVIRFDDRYNVCFKVETHNHPSAIEPYGGAATGIGGVIRDPLGTGLGAKPILSTDVFCFAPPDLPEERVPKGCLGPKRIMKGVVAGVRDYGNRMGIPTVNGAVYFDERFVGNPLVYCGNVGLLPRDKTHKEPHVGDLLVLVGGRTGRDGIHGATFSSGELSEESEVVSSGAVQIGNPIMEKKMVDVLLAARDRGLYSAITDCGGGGLSSAAGEMGAELGIEVHLERVPLKYEGLTYTEIWISEAQERMLLAVPPERVDELQELFASEDVEATVIGHFTGRKRLELYYEGHQVADLDMEFLHKGLPRLVRKAVWRPPQHPEPDLPEADDYTEDLLAILRSPNVASKEWIIRQYDHEVQGASVLKPLVGVENDGPGDAAVAAPVPGSRRGLILSCGLNPRYSDIDPYHMAASAIDEALRQIIAVGGDLERVALLDNFCWGDPDQPDRLGGLVRAAQACYDLATAFGTPFISGKDSLNNEYQTSEGTIVIPGCLLISAIAVIDDVTRCISMDLKEPGNLLYLIGLTRRELGGSHYWALKGFIGRSVPRVDASAARRTFEALSRATRRRLVRSCHDLSEGGLAVAAAEMAFAGGLGARLTLSAVPRTEEVTRDDEVLFSESNSRFLAEVRPQDAREFEAALEGVPFGRVGEVTDDGRLLIEGLRGATVVEKDVASLKAAWKEPLAW